MNIDDYLGSFSSRYFGAGHKETRYGYKTENKKKSEYIFYMTQNGSWSTKNGIEQKAHLSTIDGIVLANFAAELFMQTELQVNIESIYLSKFEIRAGSSPIENLDVISVGVIKKEIGTRVIKLHYRISGMKIVLEYKAIHHSTFEKGNESIVQELNNKQDYLSNHLRFLRHDITNISNIGDKGIVCDVNRKSSLTKELKGVNSAISEVPSLIEWLIIFSQMAQVAAYNFDCMDRAESHTLWMKNVKAEIKELSFQTMKQSMVWGEINQAKLLKMDDQTWRTFNLFGEAIDHNVEFTGKIAHQLPEDKRIGEVEKYAG